MVSPGGLYQRSERKHETYLCSSPRSSRKPPGACVPCGGVFYLRGVAEHGQSALGRVRHKASLIWFKKIALKLLARKAYYLIRARTIGMAGARALAERSLEMRFAMHKQPSHQAKYQASRRHERKKRREQWAGWVLAGHRQPGWSGYQQDKIMLIWGRVRVEPDWMQRSTLTWKTNDAPEAHLISSYATTATWSTEDGSFLV